jgi:thiol:disulfide interchange protein DsbC
MQILMLERRTSPAMVSAVLLGLGVAFAGPAAFAGDATTPAGPSPATPSTARLQRLVPDAAIDDPQPTPVNGIYRVRVGSSFVYLSADGEHVFTGDLFDLTTGENLTEAQRNGNRLAALEGFPNRALLLFPARGEERARIHVFTDSSCPYCKKLHGEVPALQEAGVTIAYIPFPRGGTGSPGDRELRAVWCADDPAAAFDIATGQASGALVEASADCADASAVDMGFRLGASLGVRGTPTIVLPSGAALPGYVDVPTLLERLRLTQTAGSPDR